MARAATFSAMRTAAYFPTPRRPAAALSRNGPYLDRLKRELALQAELFDTTRPVSQLHWGSGTPTIESAHAIDFAASFADELERLKPLADDGLVPIDRDAIRVLPAGRLPLRNDAMTFDRYLGQATLQRFSRAI